MERLSSRFDCCRQKQIRLWIILTQVFGSLLLVPINLAASAILKMVKAVTVITSKRPQQTGNLSSFDINAAPLFPEK